MFAWIKNQLNQTNSFQSKHSIGSRTHSKTLLHQPSFTSEQRGYKFHSIWMQNRESGQVPRKYFWFRQPPTEKGQQIMKLSNVLMIWSCLQIFWTAIVPEQAAPQNCWSGQETRGLHAIARVTQNQQWCFQEVDKSTIHTASFMSAFYFRSPTRKKKSKALPSRKGSLAQALCRAKGFLDLHLVKEASDPSTWDAQNIKLQMLFIQFFPLQSLLYKMLLTKYLFQSTLPEKVHLGKHHLS